MAEYIQKEPLLEHAEYDNNYRLIIPVEAIKAAPAADVVPVVRCKACKHAYINSFSAASGVALCSLSTKVMQQDDFCSYGERKDGGADNG